MQLSVSGKQIEISPAFHDHVRTAFEQAQEKYSINPVDVTAVITKTVQHKFHADISAHIGRGVYLRSQAESAEAYNCFDSAFEKLTTRLKRHKKRLVDHNKHHTYHASAAEMAPKYIIPGESEDFGNEPAPAIIAEMTAEIPTLTVGEAVMRMDLGDLPAMMFRNSAHDHLNMVYRRADGNIGWVDPKPSKA